MATSFDKLLRQKGAQLYATGVAAALLQAVDYAAMRALLDLEVGTDFYSIAAANAAFQPIDSDLTSWAGVTRASGFDTFVATPSSANLDSLVTDDTGSGALVFGTSPTLTTPVLSGLLNASAASAGILFASDGLGTSSDVNALDAYEEGTWIPVLTASGTEPTGQTYSTQTGHYTKIGDTVICFIRLVTTSKGTGGTSNSRISGLPFTANAVAMFAQGITVGNVPLQTNFTTHVLNVNPSATNAGLVECGNNVAQTATTWANLSNTTTLIGCFIYKV